MGNKELNLHSMLCVDSSEAVLQKQLLLKTGAVDGHSKFTGQKMSDHSIDLINIPEGSVRGRLEVRDRTKSIIN